MAHKPWKEGQTHNYPHTGNCGGCRSSRVCNVCGAGLQVMEACTNGRCRRCHADTCTGGGPEVHGYGDPMKFHGPKSE